jgi:catechol 2,3-dioxygenase-like lactoylglutathione lyase family enzyme
VINGFHALLYSPDPARDRAFLRDLLGFRHVDAGEGWLIFALPPAELGVHPASEPGAPELYLMCDDLAATMRELAAKGAAFVHPAQQAGFGAFTAIHLPGGGQLGLYEPRHPLAITPGS